MNTAINISPAQRRNAIRQIERARRCTFKELNRVERSKQRGRLDEIQECLNHITRLDTLLAELAAQGLRRWRSTPSAFLFAVGASPWILRLQNFKPS
ncbi:MAG: hypothetical protein ABSF53_27810, partial [Terracidiphilus sp.]